MWLSTTGLGDVQSLALVHLCAPKVVHLGDSVHHDGGVGIWKVLGSNTPDVAIFWHHDQFWSFALAVNAGASTEAHRPGAVAEEGNHPKNHDAGEYIFADGLCNSQELQLALLWVG